MGVGRGDDAAILQVPFVSAPVGIGVCDEDGRFLAVNEALAGLLGYSAGEMVGRPFLRFVHPRERAASLASYFASVVGAAAHPARRAARAQLRCRTARGDELPVSVMWTVTAPDADGRQYGIVRVSSLPAHEERPAPPLPMVDVPGGP